MNQRYRPRGSWKAGIVAILAMAAFLVSCGEKKKSTVTETKRESVYYGDVDNMDIIHPMPGRASSVKPCPDDRHPHAIDLGLPSGTKWACCNVGASAPEGYGSHFAWGETRQKDVYNEYTYQLDIDFDIAGTDYDAATANWGAPWRMPSREQIMELVDNCASEWTTLNDVTGRDFTGPNGETLFLPTARDRWERGETAREDPWGFYWSSTPYEFFFAYGLQIDSDYANCNRHIFHRGFSVRPVR